MRRLSADVILVGDYVTVVSGPNFTRPEQSDQHGNVLVEESVHENTSYQGDLFRVKVIDLPFVILDRLTGGVKGIPDTWQKTIDLRHFILARVSDEFVEATKKGS